MDTIVAISTAMGQGAISIIRLSGDEAIAIANKIVKGVDLSKKDTHTISYCKIYDKDEYVDEVMISIFKKPKTYTREDVVEINCHGSMFLANKIMELLVDNGARIADPGEFTKRAFLNGRIDLTQAEAVMDVINAQTDNSLRCANVALRGDVKDMVKELREQLVSCIAKVEVNIDYPEYEDEQVITNDYLEPILLQVKEKLEKILDRAKTSSFIRDGIKTVIIGQPNVGKSSLLNALLHEDKAIVTNIAGTTRDTVEGRINIGGVLLNLIDTAGIRETVDEVEKIGVEKTKKVLNEAELVILILDNSMPLNKIDYELLDMTKDKKRLVIVNKTDLKKENNYQGEALEISLLDDDSVETVINSIKNICNLQEINQIDATYIGNARQTTKIKEAYNSISDSLKGIEMGYPVDLINIDITNAWKALGELIGEGNPEELINNLFTNFCLGK